MKREEMTDTYHKQLIEVIQWFGFKYSPADHHWHYGQHEIHDSAIHTWIDLEFCFTGFLAKLPSDPTTPLATISQHFLDGSVVYEAGIRSMQHGTMRINSYPANNPQAAIIGCIAQWITEKRALDARKGQEAREAEMREFTNAAEARKAFAGTGLWEEIILEDGTIGMRPIRNP